MKRSKLNRQIRTTMTFMTKSSNAYVCEEVLGNPLVVDFNPLTQQDDIITTLKKDLMMAGLSAEKKSLLPTLKETVKSIPLPLSHEHPPFSPWKKLCINFR